MKQLRILLPAALILLSACAQSGDPQEDRLTETAPEEMTASSEIVQLEERIRVLEEVERLDVVSVPGGKPVLQDAGASQQLMMWLIGHADGIETMDVYLRDYDETARQWIVDPIELGPSGGDSPRPTVTNDSEETEAYAALEGAYYHMAGNEVTDTGLYPAYADEEEAARDRETWQGRRAVLYLKDGEILAVVRAQEI